MVESTVKSVSEAIVDLTEKEPIHVLHVDDEAGFLKATKQSLEVQGWFQVDTASSVQEAMEKMKKKTFDAIVCDYVMPKKDGLEFLKELRQKGDNIPFIIFTGKGREEIAIRALNLGAGQYLNKTGDPETVYGELAYGIRQAVERSEVSIKLQQSLENTMKRSDELAILMKSSTKMMRTKDLRQRLEVVSKTIRKIGWRRVVISVRDEDLEPTDLVTEGLTKEEIKLLLERKAHGTVWRERFGPKFNRFKIGDFYYLPWSDPWVREKVHGVPAGISLQKATTYAGVPSKILPEKMVDWHPQDMLYAPLRLPDGQIVGIVSIDDPLDGRRPSKDSLIALELFLNQAAVAIENAQLMHDLHTHREALRESEEKYRKQFEEAMDVIFVADAETGIIVDCNRAASELVGRKKSELIGKHQRILHPSQQIEGEFSETFRKHLEEKEGQVLETQVITKKGEIKDVAIKANVFELRGKKMVQGIFRDITERKKTEERLEESKRHFQTLFNVMVDPVVIVDGKGKFLEVTERVEEITGFKKEELLGKNFLRTKIVTAKSKAVLIKNLAKRMIGMSIAPYEVEVLTKDGRKLPYEINAAKIEYRGKPADLVVFRDISERKKVEDKLDVVGKLARHDVRNKLTVVTNNVYLAKQRLTDDHKALEFLRDVESAVQQTERIFDFARTYEKLGVEKPAYMDAEKTLRHAITLVSNLHNIKVVNGCRGLTVLADSLLRQIFYNLIHNSLRHGEKVSQIRVHYKETEKDQLKLVYEDDGVGIPKAEKEKIFEEGYGKDTGYGLYLIRKMCEVYGWAIQETGKQGKGAKFTITIPKMGGKGRTNYKLH